MTLSRKPPAPAKPTPAKPTAAKVQAASVDGAAMAVLLHSTMPAIVFAAPLSDDDASVIDLRSTDLPVADVTLRNELRRAWRANERIAVRIDEEPSAAIVVLLHELARREVRITSDVVDRFSNDHGVVVRTAAAAPPVSLVRFFPIRVRAQGRAHAGRR